MGESTIVVGDWVVAGGRDDLDMGHIVALDGAQADVAWETGQTTPCDLDAEDAEVFGGRAAAEARYHERRKADPPRYAVPGSTEDKNLDRAMGLAAEYRTLRERGDNARLPQIRSTIEELVGSFVDGKLTIPAAVREEMGQAGA